MGKNVDFLVIGGGPSGHRAAIQAARAGKSVLLVEKGANLGGECVSRGTIPSKILRETAVHLTGLRKRSEAVFDVKLRADTKVASLMQRLKSVRENNERYMEDQLDRNGVQRLHGRATFVSSHKIEVVSRNGARKKVTAKHIVVATGSRPWDPETVPIDHEMILDSDSILTLIYLPKTMAVLGGGVIACEFASIFTSLGVEVTIIDDQPAPLDFLDPELSSEFVRTFESEGGRFIGSVQFESVAVEGYECKIQLDNGEVITVEKCLCALGRVANVNGLNLKAAGIELTDRTVIPVDEFGRTEMPHIYAVGDVVGPPALAAPAIMQGRNAIRHALGLSIAAVANQVPISIYAIPEIASIGLTEEQAREQHGEIVVGRATFGEIARGQINGHVNGLLKLVVAADGKLLGAHIAGEGAAELIHLAQIAICAKLTIDVFLQNVFNFPTLAEAYQVAALSVSGQIVRQQVA